MTFGKYAPDVRARRIGVDHAGLAHKPVPTKWTRVVAHMQAVGTMTASFTQTDRRGGTLSGKLLLKRPGHVRFEYQKGVPLLIVGDGKALTMIDYEVKQVQRWPIRNSPLAALLDPGQDLAPLRQARADLDRRSDQRRSARSQAARVWHHHNGLCQAARRARRPDAERLGRARFEE